MLALGAVTAGEWAWGAGTQARHASRRLAVAARFSMLHCGGCCGGRSRVRVEGSSHLTVSLRASSLSEGKQIPPEAKNPLPVSERGPGVLII